MTEKRLIRLMRTSGGVSSQFFLLLRTLLGFIHRLHRWALIKKASPDGLFSVLNCVLSGEIPRYYLISVSPNRGLM